MRETFLLWLATAGVVGLLSSCVPAVQTGGPAGAVETSTGRCGAVAEYRPGTALSGAFTADDCTTSEAGRQEPVDQYRFQVAERTDLYVVAEAPGLGVELKLLREDGSEVARDDWTGDLTFVSTQVVPGTYRLQLRSRGDERLFGGYMLRSSTGLVGFEGCLVLPDAPVSGVVQGEWAVDDCRRPLYPRWNTAPVDYYLVRVPARQELGIALESPSVGGTVDLFARDGTPVAQADASTGTGRLEAQLAAGEYVLRVGIVIGSERTTGRYTLRIR